MDSSRLLVITSAAAVLALAVPAAAQQATAEMHAVSAEGIGEAVGTVQLADSAEGLVIQHGSPATCRRAPHGFHLHSRGQLRAGARTTRVEMTAAQAAAGHYDPDNTGRHAGPEGDGHKGDLPVLEVAADGTAQVTLTAPRLTVADAQRARAHDPCRRRQLQRRAQAARRRRGAHRLRRRRIDQRRIDGVTRHSAGRRSFGAQAELGDLAPAVEADRRVRQPGAAAGVAPHLAVAPQAGVQVPVARQMRDQRAPARQAQLTAVAVAAQIQVVARRRRPRPAISGEWASTIPNAWPDRAPPARRSAAGV